MQRVFLYVAVSAIVAMGTLPAPAAEPASSGGEWTGQATRRFEIPRGPLGAALTRFGELAGMRLLVASETTAGLRTRGIAGDFTPPQALSALLLGTGLTWRLTGSDTIVLERPAPGAPDRALVLDPVRVEGRDDGRDAGGVYDTPGSVAVVTREQLERLPPRNTADALAGIPGVMTSNDRQNPGVRINIRGLEGMGRINATIDGARQNYQQSGHTGGSSVYVDPELLSGVRITFGPNSGVGGAGVIGGTVNFRTLTVEDVLLDGQRLGSRLHAMTGTNRYDFAGSAALGLRGERVDLLAAYSAKDIGDYKTGRHGGKDVSSYSGQRMPELAFSRQDQASGLLKAGWQLANDQRITLGYVGFDAKYIDNDISEGEYSYRNRNHIRVNTLTLSDAWYPDSDFWRLDGSLWYTRTSNDQFREDRGGVGYGTFDVHYETNTAGGSLENTSQLFRSTKSQGEMNYGLEVFHDWTDPHAVAHDGGDPEWFSNATPAGKRYVGSLFTQLRLSRGDWLEGLLGLRYDWYRLTGSGNVYTGPNEFGTFYQPFELDRRTDRLAPTLRIAVKPWTSAQLYLSYAEGFRPPMITETLMMGSHPGSFSFPYIPNPGLKEEIARNAEVGISLQFDDAVMEKDSLKAKLAAFDNRVRNYTLGGLIMMPTEIQAQGIKFSFVNIQNRVRFYGIELQSDYDSKHFFANANLTYTRSDLGAGRYNPLPFGTVVLNPDTADLGGGTGLALGTVPPELRYAVSLGSRFFERRFEIGARMQYVGDRDDLPGGVADLVGHSYLSKNYRLYDLWARWAPHRRFQLRLSVENLTDQKYVEALSSADYVAPGRTALLSGAVYF